MHEKDIKILQLLETEVDLKTMREETGLNNYQLSLKLKSLKNRGYQLKRSCYEEGIKFSLDKNLPDVSKTIEIFPITEKFRFLAISDTHFGSIYDDMKKLDSIYEYALCNQIRTIIHLGDLIEGPKYLEVQRLSDLQEQLCYVVKKYPKDESINNYILLGNHDKQSIQQYGYNVTNYLFDRRLDFVPLGYQIGQIKIYNSRILLLHKHLSFPLQFNYKNVRLSLIGHYHKSKIFFENHAWSAFVPTLSNNNQVGLPGAFDITILNNFTDLLFRSLILEPIVTPVTEVLVKAKGPIQ